jgi:hypothetical protein
VNTDGLRGVDVGIRIRLRNHVLPPVLQRGVDVVFVTFPEAHVADVVCVGGVFHIGLVLELFQRIGDVLPVVRPLEQERTRPSGSVCETHLYQIRVLESTKHKKSLSS